MKNILVTGGAGFIGSNFIQYILDNDQQELLIVNLDLLTYAGNLENLRDVEKDPRYRFVKGDVRDGQLIEELFATYQFDTVVHFAAESHVDRSIVEPQVFLTTNILGTQALLEVAKRHWSLRPADKRCTEYRPGVKYLQVSTDEVYGALGKTGLFTESTPLAPNSPYSASKASADLFVRAYYETFGLPVNITRCSNNYGPYQFPEKLIPLMIYNCTKNLPLPVYGDGMQIRDWLHVRDHCSAIMTVLKNGHNGEIYNIGGNNEKANIEIVKLILHELGKTDDLIQHVADRLGHDRRYAIDNTKITSELNWKPAYTFEQGIHETIQWYLSHMEWLRRVTSGEYQQYYSRMYHEEMNT
ncbi:dTDP-glucose 4,6-dehydratase [Anaerotruncus colihominis]|uniref:dTDP-glucose 4,6-dehydratase n=1 Tax=Anaerotruncus colihominis TaxID=169435 RepID=A0A845STL4_9FIRM|nr:dTDP-glucose 4,6-dehydratase [Anaerotruncus colihominis]MCR2027089.1 dTDP-glucose 4,6-dehydratase [Anaerotruncus colihominis]NDO37662.1 dTDP-glucose 4,6-dehydratase [Anaerotruncus colihominis]